MGTESENNSVLKEGFLVKRGHVVQNWKARWFVLKPDRLMYYKYEGSKRNSCHRGTILLSNSKITCPYLEYENRPLVLKLQTSTSEERFLEACTREERDEWAAAIGAAVQNLSSHHAQTPSPSQMKGSTSLQLHNVNLSQVVDSMYDVHTGIRLCSHVEQGSSYTNCFSGAAAVDWFVFNKLALTRVEAVTLASALLDEASLRPIGVRSADALRNAALGEQFLDDSTSLYCFSLSFQKRGSVKAEKSWSAVELSGKVVKRGYLLKQGHKVKNWKVRLFVLRAEPGFLHYYDPSKDDLTPVGSISLRSCLVSALDDNGIPSGVKGKVQGNLFKIITQTNTHYYIQAPTHEERMDWIQAIRQLT
ncbi:pleckstrin-2-like [Sinocyclocheilus rhinocerous]|uniref:Pleckstrin-2-like n=1 Tax=Sinocyclocheilus rhinocerous TaxID=307959 RepID=A0A673H3W8_9TELE|nr:PREDICTED: pleckstrin-2-like [Sinocyclocheilus rhinocerous]